MANFWLVGDHPFAALRACPEPREGAGLGSTRVTADYAGALLSCTLYKPLHSIQGRLWGEVRYQSGARPTKYTYTGQYSHTADFGLMYYVARWAVYPEDYRRNPVLGRFAQADSLVPGAGNPMAWDRYAYVLGNPLLYTDPSGHCPICFFAVGFVIGFVSSLVANTHITGVVPDYRGVRTAEKYMNPQSDSVLVAAGIAVQSEWYTPILDSEASPLSSDSSGLGIAQVSNAQMEEYGLAGLDQEDPAVAVQAMEARIGLVQDACTGCGSTDLFIAAALGQNGSGFTADSMRNAPKNSDGSVNWERVFGGINPSDPTAQARQALTGYRFDTQFMLKLYMQNVFELLKRGWTLPKKYWDVDWARINELIEMDLLEAK